jgi:hypothetical protein
MTATNGRHQATAILSGTDALVAAAKLAQRLVYLLDDAGSDATSDPRRNSEKAGEFGQALQGLCVYAATVGKWAAR